MTHLRLLISHGLTWLTHWWSPQNLFATFPPAQWLLEWWYIGFIGLCLLAGILLPFSKLSPTIKQRWSLLLWTNVTLGPILFFLRWQQIPVLGMDVWRFIEEIGTIVWASFLLRLQLRAAPQEKLSRQVEAYRSKYLPKPKTKPSS